MNEYEALARELMHSFDTRKKAPPHEEISAAMRGEMAVLQLLSQEMAPMTAGEVSKKLRMTTSRIAAVLGSLEKKGMILRQADSSDKRRVQVMLTAQGSAFCQQKREMVLRDMTHLLTQLGSEDARHFVRIMGRIHQFTPPIHPDMDEKDLKENDNEGSADEQ